MNPITPLEPTVPPEPTTMRSLQSYASNQTKAIETLLDPSFHNYHFQDTNDKHWVQFWESAWDKYPDSLDMMETVERGPDPINNPLITIPSDRVVMLKPEVTRSCWDFDLEFQKILIRSNYKEAEEFSLSSCGATIPPRLLMITGQPGIGKSVFLLCTLLRRLALKLPTVLQTKPNQALLFYEKGVQEFTQLQRAPPYNTLASENDPLGRIWALVDSNQELHKPASIFQKGPFFVIQTSSPHPVHHEWIWRIRHESFYMKLWTFAEVLQVRSIIGPATSEKELWNLYYKYGASPRNLINFSHQSKIYDRMVDEEIRKLSPQDFTELLQNPNKATHNSHLLISTGPSPTNHTSPERTVISTYVLKGIYEQVLKGQVKEMKKLYQILQNNPTTATAAGMIFKSQVHQFFKKRRVIKLLPILCENIIYKDYTTNTKKFTSLKSKELIFTDNPDTPLEVGTYYHPQSTNFPTVDSWLLTQPTPQESLILLIFQITPNEDKHNANVGGLVRVGKLVAADMEKYLVVITPMGVKPKITMPEEYLTEMFLAGHGLDAAFPVYHLQISDDVLF